MDRNDPLIKNKKTDYATAQTNAKKLLKKLPKSPFKPLDCWLVMKKVDEVRDSGIVIIQDQYNKDRTAMYVVLDSGPGWRPIKGITEQHIEIGTTVPTDVKRGDIVIVVERLVHKVKHGPEGCAIEDEEDYYLVESHKILCAVDDL